MRTAHITIIFSCGHKGCVTVRFAKSSDRDRRIKWLEENTICPACYKEKKHAEENKAAAGKAINDGLPLLTGTPKQIAWAETLRNERLDSIENNLNTMLSEKEIEFDKAQECLDYFEEKTAATFWIDYRPLSTDDIIKRFLTGELKKEEKKHA